MNMSRTKLPPHAGTPRPRFGELLQQFAGVSKADVESALDHQATQGGRLGDILCERGVIGPDEIHNTLRRQARCIREACQAARPGLKWPYPMHLSVCLPAYNEAENIADCIDSARTILPEFVEQYEIVVVDDGSRDATAEVVAECARRDARVRLVKHEKNKGYGGAVTSGMRAATGDWVMFTDSDGQFSFLDMPQLLCDLPQHDFMVGYRYKRADHTMRLVNAWAWGRLVRLMLGVKVRDLDCAYKVFPRAIVERLQMTATGACINAEIMAQLVHAGLEFKQMPVNHYPRHRGTPTGARLGVIAKAFRELPQLWQYRHAKLDLTGIDVETRRKARAA
jgi:hypothetical protein